MSCALTCEKGVWGALLVGGGTQHIGLLSALCSVPYVPLVVKHGAGNIIVTHLINVDRLEGPLLISLASVALPSHLFSQQLVSLACYTPIFGDLVCSN